MKSNNDNDNQRSESLRRKIDLYRKYLAEGVDDTLGRRYLREIAAAEAELRALKNPPKD